MQIRLFFRNYIYDLITLISNLVITVVLFLAISAFWAFILSLFTFTVSTFYIIYLRTKERSFYFYSFDKPGQDTDWVGSGKLGLVRNEKAYEITDSSAGFILPKTLNWDDYNYKLDFKIVRTSLGFIVRAMNLSNSVMFQILENRIKPHLRINGEWIWLDEMKLEKNLNLDRWYQLVVICEKRKVRIQIWDPKNIAESLFDKTQIIPPEIKVNRQLDLEGKQVVSDYIQNIDFDFGAIGLRNYPGEVAYIKNLLVEKL